MNIILNNNPESFSAESMTINELLKAKNFTFKMLVIKINGSLVPKTDYDVATVKEADDVMVLHLISGG
ncbi:MAG: sulfur carrier protein ThiS [Syntrophothermus sp.]